MAASSCREQHPAGSGLCLLQRSTVTIGCSCHKQQTACQVWTALSLAWLTWELCSKGGATTTALPAADLPLTAERPGATALWIEQTCAQSHLHGEAKFAGPLCVNLNGGPGRKLFQKFLARDEGRDLCLGDEFASRGCCSCSDGLPLVLMSPLPGWAWQQPCCGGALVCQAPVQLPLQASTLRAGGGGPHGAAFVQ